MPLDYNPVGSYRRTFDLPESWDGREIFIHFGAVKSAKELPIGLEPPFGMNQSFMHLGFHIFDLGFHSRNSEASRPMRVLSPRIEPPVRDEVGSTASTATL